MISVIVAVAQNGIIGGGNALLWHISEDLKRFKQLTGGHAVVMGRKTFESLGRPLPNRRNVVISRRKDYAPEGVEVAASLQEALARLRILLDRNSVEVFINGGGQIYAQAMPLADRLYLTTVMHDYEGDTRFPAWDRTQWCRTACAYHERGEKFPYPFEYTDWERLR